MIRTIPAAALAATLAAGAAHAQNSTDEQIVVTAQKTNQTQVIQGGDLGVLGSKAALDVPFSVKSYSSSLILNQQSETLGEVLQNDPTVRTTLGFGNFSEQFVIRGFPLYGDDIAINGLYGVTPRQLVSPELYDQVQILNGANAFLNGAAPGGTAVGGGVNLIFKRAGAKPLTRLVGQYRGDSIFGGALDVSRRFGAAQQFGVRVNAAGHTGDTAIDDEHRDDVTIGGSLDWRGERARVSLDVGYQRYHIDRGRPSVTVAATAGGVPRPPETDSNYGQAWTYTTLRDVFGVFNAEYDLAEHLTAYVKAGARDGMEKGEYSSLTVTNAATGAATGGRLYVPRTDNNESVQFGVRGRLASGPLTHEINIGGSALWNTGRYGYAFGVFPAAVRPAPATSGSYATNLYAPRQVAKPADGLVANLVDPFPINRTRLKSIFLSDTVSAFDDLVLLTAGLRRQEIDVTTYAYTNGAPSVRYSAGATTPVVGLVVKPAARLAVYFNRIEGLAQGPIAPANTTNTGQVFPPYKSTQYETGVKYEAPRFAASVALYTTTQPNAYSVTLPGNAQPTYVVDGRQRNRGIELSLNGEPIDGLRLIGGATVTQAKLRATAGGVNEGNDAIGVPDYTVNGNVEYDMPFLRGATLTGRVVHTGEQKVDVANTLELGDWTRFDLGGRYVFLVAERPVTLRLTVDNVADKRYWASAFGGYLVQGGPRTFKASASVDL